MPKGAPLCSDVGQEPHPGRTRVQATTAPPVGRCSKPSSNREVWLDPILGHHGRDALRSLVASSDYKSTEQLFASLALFAHPDTVAQVENRNIFLIKRDQKNRHEFGTHEGLRVMLDDNKSPTDTMIWAHKVRRKDYVDLQFNHVWAASDNPECYTSLANICITPAFVAKLTDSDPEIRNLARYRSFDLFTGYHPRHEAPPVKPKSYDSLVWAHTFPPMPELEAAYRHAMKTKPKDTTVRSARELGWYFSAYEPDSSL